MANYTNLKAQVDAAIKTNGNQDITGAVLNTVLNSIIASLGAGYQFAGVAAAATNPGTPDYNVFYIAPAGTYTNFSGHVVPEGSLGVFSYNGTWTLTDIELTEAAPILYGTCETVAGTAAKTVAATNFKLYAGAQIRIVMSEENTAATPTLNVNGTGAKALYYDGEAASATNSWEAGETILAYYDGTVWQSSNSQGGGGMFATGEKVKETAIVETVTPAQDGLPTVKAVAGGMEGTVRRMETRTLEDIESYYLLDHVFANADGAISENTRYDSIQVPVLGGEKVRASGDGFGDVEGASFYFHWYDAAGNHIGRSIAVVTDASVEAVAPEGTRYAGFCVANRQNPVWDVKESLTVQIVYDGVAWGDGKTVFETAIIDGSMPGIVNLRDSIGWTNGALTGMGAVVSDPNLRVSDMIDIGDAYAVAMTPVQGNVVAALYIVYDENGTPLSGYDAPRTGTLFEYGDTMLYAIFPFGGKKVRFMGWQESKNAGGFFGLVTLADRKRGTEPVATAAGVTRARTSFLPGRFENLGRIEITSELLTPNASNNTISPLTTSKNEVGLDGNGDIDGSVTIQIEVAGMTVTDNISISYQGNTTLADPKKGFSIDMEHKHRFGSWLNFDSFHLKAYYTDWEHARDLVSNAVLEQIYQSRAIGERRPYMQHNDFASTDPRNGIDAGALCHVAGMPAELYINGVYWGLYSLNIKKDRKNYYLNKSNNQHIMVDVGTEGMINSSTGAVVWTSCEFRNPKGLTKMNGDPYDGDHPSEIADGDVKKSWLRFANWLHGITAATPKSTCAQYLNVDAFVDNIVFDEAVFNIDIFRNNTLWTSWDATVSGGIATGGHWAPLLYDMDKSFGRTEAGYGDSVNGFWKYPWADVFAPYADTKCPEIAILRQIFADEIAARYRDLRARGIIDESNIAQLFSAWTMAVGQDCYDREIARWPGLADLLYCSADAMVKFFTGRLDYLDKKYGYDNGFLPGGYTV